MDATRGERAPGPVLAGGARSYTQVVAGFVHTCGLTVEGEAFCWGSNEYRQLGSSGAPDACGGRPCSKTPTPVSGGLRFTTLAAGWVHTCGISTDGRTYCWGGGAMGGSGYLGNGSATRSASPVLVASDSAFVSLTLGDGHSCALTRSGAAFCWGQNTRGQLGDGTLSDQPLAAAVAPSLRFRALAAGANHTCGITTDDRAYCWGDNRWGQLGTGDVAYNGLAHQRVPAAVAGGQTWRAIAAGWEHTCAITTSGVAHCWGRNDLARQLGDDSAITHRGVPGPVSGTHQFASLAAGALATCARTGASELYCWDSNYHGSLGNAAVAGANVGRPVRAQGGPFAQAAIGQSHACGLATDQRLWCWGDQSLGQF